MKQLFTILFSVGLLTSVSAQQVTDTVFLGSNIQKQDFYSLLNGSQANVDNDDWDIAFQVNSAFATCVMINPANGTELWLHPGDTNDWATLTDTTGISNWTQRYNSDTNWTYGAFSQDQSGFDIGWGTYNEFTHEIIGDRIFVIKLGNGVYQKVWIKHLIAGVYEFRHASLDNSMDMTHSLKKDDFSGKNFGYFSLQTHGEKDREPDTGDWDLVFGKYTAFVPSAYNVTGVLQNFNVTASKAYPVNDPDNYTDWQAHSQMTEINSVGYDWKSYDFNNNIYNVADSTVYFVRNEGGDVFKMVFKLYGWDGSMFQATGEVVFTKEHVHFASVAEEEAIEIFEIYPNPASDVMTIAYNSKSEALMNVFDQTGRAVLTQQLNPNQLTTNVDVSNLNPGLYILVLSTDGNRVSKKVIIR